MTSNTEYIRRALREVALRRQVAITKAEQARQRALVVVPELSRLENERRLAGIAATRLAVKPTSSARMACVTSSSSRKIFPSLKTGFMARATASHAASSSGFTPALRTDSAVSR